MSRTAAVITLSDKGSRGERIDTAGPEVVRLLTEAGYEIAYTTLIPDDYDTIRATLLTCCDELGLNLVVTTGGTGFSRRDVTPEATLSVAERQVPGIAEAMRLESLKITPMAMLSRGVAVLRGNSLIVNLPGSRKAARENLQTVLRPIAHGLDVLLGQSGDCAPMHTHSHGEEPVHG